ncbi:MAG: serine/threonine protein kinase [Glaciimonas sp.]|nr:serine/threonine protein kinase [Glaciimonas sp.]
MPASANADGSTLHQFNGFRFAVFPRHGGRSPELEDSVTLEWLGRFMGRIHAIGRLKTFQHRLTLDITTFGIEPSNYLLESGFVPEDLLAAYRSKVTQALEGVRRCFAHAGDIGALRFHGDPHGSNILWTDAGPHFVDFEDSPHGTRCAGLMDVNVGRTSGHGATVSDLLAGYEDFCDFDPRELHLTEALRTLRLIHYSA